jgi:PKD domain-containing protein
VQEATGLLQIPPRFAPALRRCLLLQAVLVLVVAGPAWAAPAASFEASATHVLPGQPVTFTSTSTENGLPITSYLWSFGDGTTDSSGPVVEHAFPAGIWNVRLTVSDGEPDTSPPTQITANTPPSPNFVVFPAQAMTGQTLDFISVSTDPDGHAIPGLGWSFNDGTPSVTGQHVQHVFEQPGTHTVTLIAVDSLGGFNSTQKQVPVSSPVAVRTPTDREPDEPARLMSPFPLVRLSGDLTETGALIRVLAVRAPRGASILVRCRGKGCPARRITTRSRGRTLSFKRYRRNLRAGTVIEVLVSRKGRIGKYTRFLIRDERSPKRTDRCLMPGATKGSPCPND